MPIPFTRKLRPSPSMFLAVISLLIASASVAYAAVPDTAGVIHGCITTRTGALRVIDTEASPAGTCSSGKERPITWNAQGIQGAPGEPGAAGAPGPAGLISATYIRRSAPGTLSAQVQCDTGDIVTGGGGSTNGTLLSAFPYTADFSSYVPIGYFAQMSSGSTVTAFVVCADATP